jgi:hypothetical protein
LGGGELSFSLPGGVHLLGGGEQMETVAFKEGGITRTKEEEHQTR